MAPVRQHLERDEQGAPKARPVSTRAKQCISGFFADAAKVDQAKSDAKTSKFYGHHSPATRQKRAAVQAEFEWIIKEFSQKDEVLQSEIFNLDTFKDYTKMYLSCCADYIQGRIGAKPKAGTLHARLRALCWWALRRIDAFSSIHLDWRAECQSHIYFLADTLGFETGSYDKNQLGDAELSLFFRTLPHLKRGQEAWKQAYSSWALVFMCGVRPSSYTLGKGYEKGAPLGDGSVLREHDETFRWSDCVFTRGESGISVKVTFRYMKSTRDPHATKQKPAKKTWSFFPIGSNRYEFDRALLFTATAFSRGLFGAITLQELFNGREMYPPVDPVINKHPVFLDSDQNEKLCPGKPQTAGTVNFKLQEICRFVGLFQRNTMYSFRRTMIQEVRRKHGSEYAKAAAGHSEFSTTIETYDNVGRGDIDWVSDRLNESGLTRQRIREYYSQMHTQRVQSTVSDPESLSKELKKRVEDQLKVDPDILKADAIIDAELIDIGYQFQVTDIRIAPIRTLLLANPAHADKLRRLDEMLAARKQLRKSSRRKYDQEAQNDMTQQHRSGLERAAPNEDEGSASINTDIMMIASHPAGMSSRTRSRFSTIVMVMKNLPSSQPSTTACDSPRDGFHLGRSASSAH